MISAKPCRGKGCSGPLPETTVTGKSIYSNIILLYLVYISCNSHHLSIRNQHTKINDIHPCVMKVQLLSITVGHLEKHVCNKNAKGIKIAYCLNCLTF